jgi:hypothetical protein
MEKKIDEVITCEVKPGVEGGVGLVVSVRGGIAMGVCPDWYQDGPSCVPSLASPPHHSYHLGTPAYHATSTHYLTTQTT